VIGHLVAHRAGHALHTEFASRVLEETQAWRFVEGPLEVAPAQVAAALPLKDPAATSAKRAVVV
jgi:UDP-3-O-acyl-N-acetylglucosamine deacetylase